VLRQRKRNPRGHTEGPAVSLYRAPLGPPSPPGSRKNWGAASLKVAALNAEKLLVRQFDQTYKQPKDAFSVLRSLLHLPGYVRALGPDCLEVRLERPDSEKVAHALEELLTDINQDPPRMLSDGPALRFIVQG